jgi:hypothetical protein
MTKITNDENLVLEFEICYLEFVHHEAMDKFWDLGFD